MTCILSFLTTTITRLFCSLKAAYNLNALSMWQCVVEANIIAPLVNLLQNAEFDIKKEAAWAISNATSGGSQEQIKYVSLFL